MRRISRLTLLARSLSMRYHQPFSRRKVPSEVSISAQMLLRKLLGTDSPGTDPGRHRPAMLPAVSRLQNRSTTKTRKRPPRKAVQIACGGGGGGNRTIATNVESVTY